MLSFTLDGCLIHAGLNFSGSWHDSRLAYKTGFLLICLNGDNKSIGPAVLCDSVFSSDSEISKGKNLWTRKAGEGKKSDCVELGVIEHTVDSYISTESQSAEWNVQSLKGPFGKLRPALSKDNVSRAQLLYIYGSTF